MTTYLRGALWRSASDDCLYNLLFFEIKINQILGFEQAKLTKIVLSKEIHVQTQDLNPVKLKHQKTFKRSLLVFWRFFSIILILAFNPIQF